jgi:hypothetical protein
MPMNYNFKDNWNDIILPHLDTVIMKKAMKKGILGYLNNDLFYGNKLKNFKFDKPPYEYSSCITLLQSEWEDEIIKTLKKHGILKLEYDKYDVEYDDYKKEYIDPILEPYLKKYKKTHMDAFCLWGGCHWWNPTFCLTLANIILPDEEWRVRRSEYHTTIVNKNDTKIFDILYYDKDDATLGGDNAYKKSNMTKSEVLEYNKYKKINNCPDNEIYNNTFNSLEKNLNEINKNMNKVNKTLDGLSSLIMNKEDDTDNEDATANEDKYELENKIMEELFPNADFDVCLPINELSEIITNEPEVKLIQTFDCYCYSNSEMSDKTFIIKSDKPMTKRYVINELIKQNFRLECNHRFLELLDISNESNNTIEYFLGS